MAKSFCPPCLLSCNLSSQDSTLVHPRNYGWYIGKFQNQRTNISLSLWIHNAVLTIDNVRMLFYLLKNQSVFPSQEENAWLKGLLVPLLTTKCTFRLIITDFLTLRLIANGHQLSTSLPIPDHFFFRTLPFLLLHAILSARRASHPVLPLYPTPQSYFKTQVRHPRGRLVPSASMYRFRRRPLPSFQNFWLFAQIISLKLGIWFLYRELDVLITLRNGLLGIVLH